jgi:hypothetical protein
MYLISAHMVPEPAALGSCLKPQQDDFSLDPFGLALPSCASIWNISFSLLLSRLGTGDVSPGSLGLPVQPVPPQWDLGPQRSQCTVLFRLPLRPRRRLPCKAGLLLAPLLGLTVGPVAKRRRQCLGPAARLEGRHNSCRCA